MAMKRTHDAVYGGEKYTDREGNEKTRFINVGSLFERDDGSLTLKLESIPVGFNGWVNFYVPKPKDGQTSGQQRQGSSRQAPPADDFGDDLPPF